MQDNGDSWHLDKKVPVGIILAIVIQTGIGAYWVSQQEGRLTQAIAENVSQGVRLHDIELDAQSQRVMASAVGQQIAAMKDTLDQMRTDGRETNSMLRQLLSGGTK